MIFVIECEFFLNEYLGKLFNPNCGLRVNELRVEQKHKDNLGWIFFFLVLINFRPTRNLNILKTYK